LVTRVLDQVHSLGVADAVVVATDASEIAEVVRKHGGVAVLTDSKHPSGTDRVAEVSRREEWSQYDEVLNVQGDEPFVSSEAVHGALSMLRAGFELGTVAARASAGILTDPNVVKAVRADDGRALYFSRAPIPWLRDQSDHLAQHELILQHIGVYAYRRDALLRWVTLPVHPLEQVERLEQLRPLALGMSMGIAVLDTAPPRGVDTEDDLAGANARWHDLHAGRTS
jgi:3-deoxy-manno-octulosonate cytidylyltransferase (CMP-KDO synthetase)